MIKYLHILFLVLISTTSFAQIKEFYITCNQTSLDYIYDNYEQDLYIPITLTYNGTTWNDVSMRIRGDGSRVYPKKSLKVKFNSDSFIDNRTSLNFNAEWEDQSYIQQYMASILMMQSGQKCFDTEHVRLYLNGTFFGLYLLVEAVDEQFLDKHEMSLNGTLYKAALDGSSLSVFDVPQYHWEQKAGPDINMADLQLLINGINDHPQADYLNFTDQHFNRSEVVNLISMNLLLSLGSTYYHNYFMYHNPVNDKWEMLPWDMDKTLLYYGSGFPYHRSSTAWAPDNPYHERSIHDPSLLTEIRSRISELQTSMFNLATITPIIDSLQTIIGPSVEEDLTDDISDTGQWQTKVTTYKNYVNQRVENLLAQIDQYPRNFTVERVATAEPNSELTIHWTASESPVQRPISYKLFFGSTLNLNSEASIILDNLSDTLVQFTLPSEEGVYYYKVVCYDGYQYVDGFDTYNPLIVTDNVPDLVINEINYNSSPDFFAGDWVELYNPLTTSVDLSDWQLKDNQNDHVFTFPSGTSILGNGYIILSREIGPFQTQYPNVSNVVGGLPFGLSNGGDAVRLFHSSGLLVDEVIFQDTLPWAPEADGLGPTLELSSAELDNTIPENWIAWTDHHGTPGEQNMQLGIWEDDSEVTVGIHPNPFKENRITVFVEGINDKNIQLTISDMLGQTLYTSSFDINMGKKNSLLLYPGLRSAGNYLLNIHSNSIDKTVKLLYNPSSKP